MRSSHAAAALIDAVTASRDLLDEVETWSETIADALLGGGRLLVAGNGGSAAEAQHLTAEMVGRFEGERRPLSAIALHAETSSLTAITNDYGAEQAFARQVHAHGRSGDVLLVLSTSGESANVVAAVRAAHELEITPLALTGPGPHALRELCSRCACVPCDRTATIQEVHLLCVHVLCAAIDRHVHERSRVGPVEAGRGEPAPDRTTRRRVRSAHRPLVTREPVR